MNDQYAIYQVSNQNESIKFQCMYQKIANKSIYINLQIPKINEFQSICKIYISSQYVYNTQANQSFNNKQNL